MIELPTFEFSPKRKQKKTEFRENAEDFIRPRTGWDNWLVYLKEFNAKIMIQEMFGADVLTQVDINKRQSYGRILRPGPKEPTEIKDHIDEISRI